MKDDRRRKLTLESGRHHQVTKENGQGNRKKKEEKLVYLRPGERVRNTV